MNDIIASMKQAMIQQGWIYGDAHRVGHPFEWIDGDRNAHLYNVPDCVAVLEYISMFYEAYPTPDVIIADGFHEMLQVYKEVMGKTWDHFLPFLPRTEVYRSYLDATALVRAQDYTFIKKNCEKSPATHLDIGPGLGTHAIYSLKGFNSRFFAVEASPHSYAIQRHFFRFLSVFSGRYVDLIDGDTFGVAPEVVMDDVISGQYALVHVPSWHFDRLGEKTIDLVTATWVLNEVNHAGILWLLAHASRVLKQNGYFYIRDSGKLKPNRHNLNYDHILGEIGFELCQWLDVQNRVNYFGVPRIYRKKRDTPYTFHDLCQTYLGKFAIVSHGGDYNQGMPTDNG